MGTEGEWTSEAVTWTDEGLQVMGARVLVEERRAFVARVDKNNKLVKAGGEWERARWGEVISVGDGLREEVPMGVIIAFGAMDSKGAIEPSKLRYGDREMVLVPEEEILAVEYG